MITAWSDNDSPQVMYLVHAIEKFHVIPWLMIEFGFCALWSFFFFTAALAFAVKVKLLGPNSQLLPKICFGGWLPLAPDNTCSCAWVICTHKQLPLLRRAYMPYTIQRISFILYPSGLHSLPHPQIQSNQSVHKSRLWFPSGWPSFSGCWCSIWVCMLFGELLFLINK